MPLHNYCTALGFGTQNQCVRCVRVTISSLGRYVAVLVFLRKAQSLSQAGELDSSMSRRDFYWRYRQRKRRLELRYYEPSCTFDRPRAALPKPSRKVIIKRWKADSLSTDKRAEPSKADQPLASDRSLV